MNHFSRHVNSAFSETQSRVGRQKPQYVTQIDRLPRCRIWSLNNNNIKCQSWSPSARHFRCYLKWMNCARWQESGGSRKMGPALLAQEPITYAHLGGREGGDKPVTFTGEQWGFNILTQIWWWTCVDMKYCCIQAKSFISVGLSRNDP